MTQSIFDAVRDGNAEDLRRILEADPMEANRKRVEITPLMVAVRENHLECVEILIEAGADLDLVNAEFRWAPLHEAVKQANVPMVFALLEYGPDWTLTDKHGNSIYHLAAVHGQEPGLIRKLHAWTDQFSPDGYRKDGKTALMLATEHRRLAQVEALLSIGADPFKLSRDQKLSVRGLAEGWPEGLELLDRYERARPAPAAPVVDIPAPQALEVPAAPSAPAAPALAANGLSSIQRRRSR